ncbi:hypothetical protein TNCV_2059421 [Trichonephila clavipes]|uniref:Integrase zinc-binding domain-containing protein n=1 Tax=Trichonephila clavipes TaxID=2585209 RepID=A0A8X6R8G6_TRICX|nr:hypothetical protein TNCV_2059421 [Trichonephila clavipes]
MNLSLQVFCDASKSSHARRDFRLPIVLPFNHPIVKALIIYKHGQLGHAGVKMLMYTLRESYRILKGRKTINPLTGYLPPEKLFRKRLTLILRFP